MGDTKRVLRYQVPIDDNVHAIPDGAVVHVDTRRRDAVEAWVEIPGEGATGDMRVQVFGTGHVVPDYAVHLGTALSPSGVSPTGDPATAPWQKRGALVWHLFRLDA